MHLHKAWMKVMLIVCLASLLLIACTNNSNNSNEPATQTPESAEPATQTPESGGTSTESAGLLPFKETQTFSIFGKGYWNPIDTPIAYQDIKAKLNVDFEWEVYPDGYDEKKDIVLATKSLKDLNQVYIRDGFNYGPKGAFLDLSKYLDNMPNLKAKIDENEDVKYAFQDENGSFYVAPQFVKNANDSDFGLSVNKDKFDEWGIPYPTNLDEVYAAAKTIKAMDAKYYPIIGWTAPNQLFTVLRALMNYAGIGDEPDVRYFDADGIYKYSLLQPEFKEAVAWLAKLYAEELIYPEYPTITSGQSRGLWSEWSVKGDNIYDHFIAFIGSFSPNNSDQFSRFKELVNKRDGEGSAFSPTFQHLWLSDNMSFNIKRVEVLNGLAINADLAKDETKLNNALAFVDWLYTDEAYMMQNYGREGWHYDIIDGKPVLKDLFVFGKQDYMDALVSDRFKMYAEVGNDPTKISIEDQLYSWGFYEAYNFMPLRMIDDRDSSQQQNPSLAAHDIIYSKLAEQVAKATTTGIKPLPFSADEVNKITALSQAARDLALTEVDKFILGKRSMEEFDSFITDLKRSGAQELENMYNAKLSYLN